MHRYDDLPLQRPLRSPPGRGDGRCSLFSVAGQALSFEVGRCAESWLDAPLSCRMRTRPASPSLSWPDSGPVAAAIELKRGATAPYTGTMRGGEPSARPARVTVRTDSPAEETLAAASLREFLLDTIREDLEIQIARERRDTQDMGSTLVLLFGAPAVVAIARGIADWLRKRRFGSTIELEIGGARIKLNGEVADDRESLRLILEALKRESDA
jgi:hypothetical protein